MIATVDNPSNAAEWALAEMVNRLVSLLSVLPQLKFWASYATGLHPTLPLSNHHWMTISSSVLFPSYHFYSSSMATFG